MIRSTSTMRATLCRRVTPRFSSEALSRATAAFLLEFTAIDPLSFPTALHAEVRTLRGAADGGRFCWSRAC